MEASTPEPASNPSAGSGGTSNTMRTLEGKKAGLEKGEAEGEVKGDDEGIASGSSTALGGYDSYEPGFYIVDVEQGSGGVAYKVTSRLPMEAGTTYNICTKASADICQKPIPE